MRAIVAGIAAVLTVVSLSACIPTGGGGGGGGGSSSGPPEVTIYGAANSFGSLASASALPGGQTVGIDPVSGWTPVAGQSLFHAALDAYGNLLIANEPQTDNQNQPTADSMSVTQLDPNNSPVTMHNISLDTTGRCDASITPSGGVGGADVSEVQPVPGGIAFTAE